MNHTKMPTRGFLKACLALFAAALLVSATARAADCEWQVISEVSPHGEVIKMITGEAYKVRDEDSRKAIPWRRYDWAHVCPGAGRDLVLTNFDFSAQVRARKEVISLR